MIAILGIDPGKTGAIAWFNGASLVVYDMPIVNNTLDQPSLRDIFDVGFPHKPSHCYFEKVSSMPRQGVASTFKFGFVTGAARQCVVDNSIPITDAPAAKWKMDMGLTKDKERSRARALSLFPGEAHYFSRKKDDGRAEAALLAFYGYMLMTGGKLR